MNSLEKLISLLSFIIWTTVPVFGQNIFDDPLIFTQWSKSTIISKSGDTLVTEAKYNPYVDPFKIEVKQGEDSYNVATSDIYELFYYDKGIDSLRLFKNVKVAAQGRGQWEEIFFEIFYDDKYFAITRGLTYSGSFALVNPLARPSLHLAIFTINKTTGLPLKDLSKKTFIKAMADKEDEIKRYIKENKIKLYALPHEIMLFKYYNELKG